MDDPDHEPLPRFKTTPAIAVAEMGNLYTASHGLAAVVVDGDGNVICEWRVAGDPYLQEHRRRELADRLMDLAIAVRDGRLTGEGQVT